MAGNSLTVKKLPTAYIERVLQFHVIAKYLYIEVFIELFHFDFIIFFDSLRKS